MKIEEKKNGQVSVTASKGQWAQLFKIIDWVSVEGGCMDDASLAMSREQLSESLSEWDKTLTKTLS